MAKQKQIIALDAQVTITAAAADGDKKGPATFDATFYTGGALEISGWELPVIVDLAGLDNGKVLVANLDHDRTKRVGNFSVTNDGATLVAHGTASASTPYRDEVVQSAADGYQWQASLEVNPRAIEEVKAGKSVEVNGQSFTGPLYVTRKGTLKGFAFVSHGADDNTTATIAASAASNKEKNMKPEIKAWAEGMGIDVDSATPETIATIEANYEGKNGKPSKIKASDNPFEARKAEAKRRADIRAIADKMIETRNAGVEEIEAIEKLTDHAITAGMTAQEFRLELYESSVPMAHTIQAPRNRSMNARVIEAAICQAGRYANMAKFTDQEQQLAWDEFKGGIGLKQLFLVCAESRGHNTRHNFDVTLDVQRAAFGQANQPGIRAQVWSGLDISTIISTTANKFVMEGWNSADRTCLNISKIQNVRDFKTITTVSLTDAVIYEKVGAGGEIKHGELSELTYTNKADTYAKMLAITRQDIINDDLGALTEVPRKLGNGAIKKLNDIFWTEFLALVGASFFASGNSNINTGVADMTVGGLDATETIFMDQTNPDGTPLGIMPAILLVPTALKNKALTLMGSMGNGSAVTTFAAANGDANPFVGRFRVESSPYISNSSYTGYTSQAWWMLANPTDLPVIAIAALNGRVEPTIDTADADFNTLGVQMRGYSDVGVKRQEYRGGVHADGNAS